ncbi:hypothetical protein [Catenovulum maritimum]|uniref:Periplasmic binding protein domain-containing protein n=1 Tax=Catenovulum maritimum TaxID=1513271 RepID=A0A0J8JQ79_9ALTE|nr:hypothetical protein [Catenovulum maritimum]KMT66881.1 hypothetical protein XM47_01910 [Catenovulum maritimum]
MKYFLILLFITPIYVLAKPLNVWYLSAGSTGYWGKTLIPMPGVAKQLDINLSIFTNNEYQQDYHRNLETLLTKYEKPDWIIWTQRRIKPTLILDTLEKHKINSIDVTSGFKDFQLNEVGHPQQRYKHWKAQVLTDEFDGGKRVAVELMKLVKSERSIQDVKLAAIAGTRTTDAAVKTVNGLTSEFQVIRKERLLQIVFATWNRNTANRLTEKLYKRYPRIDAFWSASPLIALGVNDHLDTMNFSDKERPFVGNVGWADESAKAIEEGKIAFSLIGNNLNPVWALILIKDMSQGIQIPAPHRNNKFSLPYLLVNKANLEKIKPLMAKEFWYTANIKQYSRFYNSELKTYNFDPALLIAD